MIRIRRDLRKKYIKAICEDLKWLGIRFDKIIKQSERLSKYKDAFDFLKKKFDLSMF